MKRAGFGLVRKLDAIGYGRSAAVASLDDYATHESPAVHRWLAARPRFHLHFTPTHASWLNQVERWFGLLSQQ